MPRKPSANDPLLTQRMMLASVRDEFDSLAPLPQLIGKDGILTPHDARTIVKQAWILLEQNYAHLPLKRAMHAVDPIQRLKLLHDRIPASGDLGMTDRVFHAELTEIFTSLHDLHTNYLLPSPFAHLTAFLPFIVEDCFEGETCKYIVTHVVDGFVHPTFVRGVEIRYWNGMPIERAVRQQGLRYAGSNPAARHARGVQTLTTRALRVSLPPDEEWVVIGYRTAAGIDEEVRIGWLGSSSQSGALKTAEESVARAGVGIDLQQQLVQRARASLFAPDARERKNLARRKIEMGASLDADESSMPHVIEARAIETSSGRVGYMRIRTFNVEPARLVAEFLHLLRGLPDQGLILDVRGNGGGYIMAGEALLQLLTPKTIVPEPFQFLNSPLNLELCAANDAASDVADLSPWTESMRQALQTGSAFSAGFPISSVEQCNIIGQRYFGPVALITDALCYSTTDIFAAGFKDHDIGIVIGTDQNTGAGGANVWGHDLLMLAGSSFATSYAQLPHDVGFRVSIRRSLRVGRLAGTPLEDLGVVPDHFYKLTPRDVLENNEDLKDFAASLLKGKPVRGLTATALEATETRARLAVTAAGMTRVDVYADERPIVSLDVKRKSFEITIDVAVAPRYVEIRGFDGDALVGRLRVSWLEIQASAPAPRRVAARGRKGVAAGARKRAAKGARADAFARTPTPNSGDDFLAVAEPSMATFGGEALEPGAAPTVAPQWRPAGSLVQLLKQVNKMAPQRKKAADGTIGDGAHELTSSDHNPWVREGAMGIVTACDITHDPAGGCDADRIAEAILASHDPRVKYIIWNRKIASSYPTGGKKAWTWRPYAGKNPHSKHIHISVQPEKAAYDSVKPWIL